MDGTLTRRGLVGLDRLAFSGRIGQRALALGRHRASIAATDAAGNVTPARRVSFMIVR